MLSVSVYSYHLVADITFAWNSFRFEYVASRVCPSFSIGFNFDFLFPGTFSDPSEPTSPVVCRDELEPPYIEYDSKLSSGVLVKAGEPIQFGAKIYGKPPPAVRWTRNGRDLDATPRIKIGHTTTHASVDIADSSRKDTGKTLIFLGK